MPRRRGFFRALFREVEATGQPPLLSVGASPNSRLIEGERVCSKPCLGLLRGVLGLLAPLLGAALQRLQPRLQVLDEGGVGTLVEALKLVGVGR